MTIPYNTLSGKVELTWEEEQELALQLEQEGEVLNYLTDEDFALLSDIEQERVLRLEELKQLQTYYSNFTTFLRDVMIELGFKLTKIQASIGEFIAGGGQYIMVEAQRSQAKTTIAAAFCVWQLIHDPKHRILIISAGGSQATDISTLIIRIIMNMDVLECIRPDKSKGDRVSVEKFDVHYSLRKLDKSASVSCCGITANLQGRRADTLLADDVESQKNSLTMLMREQLKAKTLDFASICQSGRIIYLGTPQSSDSIYTSLPARGYTVRIWPGRFPTVEQLPYYGGHIAPVLLKIMEEHPEVMLGGGEFGDQGIPIEPTFLGENLQQMKERDQGPAWYQLQHMLNTRMMDAERKPLKTKNIILMPLRIGDDLPCEVKRGFKYVNHTVANETFEFSVPHEVSAQTSEPSDSVFYIDPAGGGKGKGTHGGDETGWAHVAHVNSFLYCYGYGGIKGGYDEAQMGSLADIVAMHNPKRVVIEKNFGYGAFTAVFTPILRSVMPNVSIEEDYVAGQKEVRIIDVLEPIIARGSLIMNTFAVENEDASLRVHPDVNRIHYCGLKQLIEITRQNDSLVHDDRLDALAGACSMLQRNLVLDHKEEARKHDEKVMKKFWEDPRNRNRYDAGAAKKPMNRRVQNIRRKY